MAEILKETISAMSLSDKRYEEMIVFVSEQIPAFFDMMPAVDTTSPRSVTVVLSNAFACDIFFHLLRNATFGIDMSRTDTFEQRDSHNVVAPSSEKPRDTVYVVQIDRVRRGDVHPGLLVVALKTFEPAFVSEILVPMLGSRSSRY